MLKLTTPSAQHYHNPHLGAGSSNISPVKFQQQDARQDRGIFGLEDRFDYKSLTTSPGVKLLPKDRDYRHLK